MVQLTATAAAKCAIDEFCRLKFSDVTCADSAQEDRRERLSNIAIGSPIGHHELVEISRYLVQTQKDRGSDPKQWRLDCLLKGASIYRTPPTVRPEPTTEYKALMRQLREQEEQRQYELMLNPLSKAETFNRHLPSARSHVGPVHPGSTSDVDEISYADVNRQMILIINVLVSIICCSVAIWLAARRWSVPQRLGLSFSGSTIVAVAEVAIYLGYIKRIKDAKAEEIKKIEKKEIVDTWVIDARPTSQQSLSINTPDPGANGNVRLRKGKHR